ncbi:MAG: MerR family DNA-binding protein [Rhodobacteraceae bacterium]|mgnify:CR=1 FL=1|jgi:DNA-binding transcriptional MerR regulator|nr:MerR family DNA-binding protein [Paracoccaceae bacterium]
MAGQGSFTRGEVCEMLGLTRRAVGHYENLELISSAGHGRDKRYSRREIARLKLILRGRRFGMSLEEIRQWLNLYSEEGKMRQLLVWVDIADQRLHALRAERADLAQRIEELQILRDEVAQTISGSEDVGADRVERRPSQPSAAAARASAAALLSP